MLDRLSSPDDVEVRVRERQWTPGVHQAQVKVGMVCSGAPQRLFRDIASHDLSVSAREDTSEVALSAAEVEYAHPASQTVPLGGDVAEEERFAQTRVTGR